MSIGKNCRMKDKFPSCCQLGILLKKNWLLPVLLIVVLVLAGSEMAETASGSSSIRRVGIIVFDTPFLKSYNGFHDGLKAAGYRDGVNVEYSVHNIRKNLQLIVPLVKDFISRKYDLILSVTTPVTIEVKKAARGKEIPVLFTTVADPVGAKIVNSLKEPGGNISGVSHISMPLIAKRLLLFAEAFPGMKRVAFIHNPEEKFLAAAINRLTAKAAAASGLELVNVHARHCSEMKAACARLSKNDVDGIFMVPDTLSMAMFGDLLACSRREKLPLMVIDNQLLEKGGVMGYSPDVYDVGFQAAGMAVHIFHGIKVGRLSVQNPDKVKLVVSLKEARALGLHISRDILRRADEVIR